MRYDQNMMGFNHKQYWIWSSWRFMHILWGRRWLEYLLSEPPVACRNGRLCEPVPLYANECMYHRNNGLSSYLCLVGNEGMGWFFIIINYESFRHSLRLASAFTMSSCWTGFPADGRMQVSTRKAKRLGRRTGGQAEDLGWSLRVENTC